MEEGGVAQGFLGHNVMVEHGGVLMSSMFLIMQVHGCGWLCQGGLCRCHQHHSSLV